MAEIQTNEQKEKTQTDQQKLRNTESGRHKDRHTDKNQTNRQKYRQTELQTDR